MYFTGGRTDHTGTETDRRHEANQTEMTDPRATTSGTEVERSSVEPADHGSVEVLAMAATVE